jgi:tungstate transport system substrate-binding protein
MSGPRFGKGLIVLLATLLGLALGAQEKMTLASTTSTLDSGLFDVLIPPFEKAMNCRVRVIAVGTGQAVRLARDGNADALLVHDRAAEEQFVADGFGLERLAVMHNDFLIVGPAADPAAIGIQGESIASALRKISEGRHVFVSRGDDSGTHKMELRLWKQVGGKPLESFYLESGSGMEATLRIANEKRGYCLVDRGTWLAHRQECAELKEILGGAEELMNPYSVIVVSPARFRWVNHKLAQAFAAFIRGPQGQGIIREYGVARYGSPLFFPDVLK